MGRWIYLRLQATKQSCLYFSCWLSRQANPYWFTFHSPEARPDGEM